MVIIVYRDILCLGFGLAMIQISSTLYFHYTYIGHYSLKSLNDLLVSFEFRNIIGCERREERDLSENARSFAERRRLYLPSVTPKA